jgi:hypothetical protein
MKKILLVLMFAVAAQIASAQDFKKLQNTILLQKWEDAKIEVDKLGNDPKAQAKLEFYYYKARVYAVLFKESALRAKYPNAGDVAAAAIEKYASLDPSFAKIKDLGGVEAYFDMYSSYFQLGVKVFNEKSWLPAAENFIKAIDYIDIIIKNKWAASSTITMDTTSLLYTGYSFQNAGQMENAAKYYGRLADSKVTEPIYLDLYRFLVQHYTKVNNETSFTKYLEYGKALYPNEDWDAYEVDFIDANYDLAKKTTLYDSEDAAGKLNEQKYLQFGDLFINVKNKEKDLDSTSQAKYSLKAADAFKKAFQLNNTNALAIFNVGIIYYNIFGEYDDRVGANIRSLRGISSSIEDEFAAKKAAAKTPQAKAAVNKAIADKLAAAQAPIKAANAALEVELQKNMDIAIESIDKAYNILKDKATKSRTENNVLSKSVDFLANMYTIKRDKFRGKDAKQYDLYDAKFKEFDALHGKYGN